jgi:replicative DNA helicase
MIHPEVLLISSLLNTNEALAGESQGLTPNYFHEYRAEYEWVTDYFLKYKRTPSLEAFKNVFPDFQVVGEKDTKHSADRVKENHLNADLAVLIRETSALLRAGETYAAQDFLAGKVLKLESHRNIKHASASIADLSDEIMSYAIDRDNSETSRSVPFAHPTLQNATQGMDEGDLCIKAARLGQGKTWSLVDDAVAAILNGNNVLYYSLEMNKRQMAFRFHTVLSNILGYGFTHDMISKGMGLDLIAYKQFLGELPDRIPGSLYISDTSRGLVTPLTIAAEISRREPDLVIVDYMTLLGSSNGQRCTEGWQVVASTVGELKEVATQFGTPILAAAQINREGDSRGHWRPPKAVHLAQSDSLGQDADYVITMKRFSLGTMVYSLEKNRHGQADFLYFTRFNPNKGDFAEIPKNEAEAIKMYDSSLEDAE